jgi:transposase
MRLTDHDLKQLSQEYLASLAPEQLLHLSKKMLDDLRDARDRLNQTPQNSSRPSGNYAPWQQTVSGDKKEPAEPVESATESEPKAEKEATPREQSAKRAANTKKSKRKAGKQPGSKGMGRQVEMVVTGEVVHRPTECTACGQPFGQQAPFQATTGLYVLDIERSEHGLEVSHIKHLYGESACPCGHVTQTKPGSCPDEPGWTVALTQWHLVGPTLAALIICLSLRLRLSRPRIREFLQDWLGISLSVGCINQCLTEGGRAVAPVEDELVAEIQQSELLHADETGWKESGRTVWLWVLRSATVTLYLIGRRSWEVIANIMEQFGGWLMSDGYGQYRHYGKRLRCLAHLIRKARGLAESCHPAAAEFGQIVLQTMAQAIEGIYLARGDPTLDLMERFTAELAQLQTACEQHHDHAHEKTRQLAREFLNDWTAIWQVLAYPDLPITNNVAEQALRHWVIARKISHGTRTAEGSRAYTLLASVIDTCRQRGIVPWPYIAQVIAERRQGKAAPPIPQAVA